MKKILNEKDIAERLAMIFDYGCSLEFEKGCRCAADWINIDCTDKVDKLLDEILLAFENGNDAIITIKQIIKEWRK